ncbi:type II secretion system F family protein [Thermaerobacter litoralis]
MGFYYVARHGASGRKVQGRIEAESISQVLGLLHASGYTPLAIRRESRWRDADIRELLGLRRSSLATRERAAFFRQLATMVRAGLPLSAAMESLIEQSRGRLRQVSAGVLRDIRSGQLLHEALARQGGAFDEVHVALVRAAELAGRLDEVLSRLASDEERRLRVEGKVRSALAYPAFVLVVALAVVAVMVTFIVPTFVGIFEQFDVPLPWPTRFWVALMTHPGLMYLVLVVTGLLITAVWLWARSATGRRYVDAWLLRAPVFGPVVRSLVVARVTRGLASMVRSGFPLLDALDAAARLAGNHVFRVALEETRKGVERGGGLSAALRVGGVFPALVVDLVAIGERSGALDELLERAATVAEEETDNRLAALTSLLEPVLVVLMGGVVGFIALSVFLPLFSLMSSVTQIGP